MFVTRISHYVQQIHSDFLENGRWDDLLYARIRALGITQILRLNLVSMPNRAISIKVAEPNAIEPA